MFPLVPEATVVSPCPPMTGPSQLPETHTYHPPPRRSTPKHANPKTCEPSGHGQRGGVWGIESVAWTLLPP